VVVYYKLGTPNEALGFIIGEKLFDQLKYYNLFVNILL
jgi:hypothetical protein